MLSRPRARVATVVPVTLLAVLACACSDRSEPSRAKATGSGSASVAAASATPDIAPSDDPGGYVVTDSTHAGGPTAGPFASIAPAEGGSGTDIGNHCAQCSTLYQLPFPVRLYDTASTWVSVSADGTVDLLNSARFEDSGALVVGFPRTMSTADRRAGDGVFLRVSGTAGHRSVTLEWRAVMVGHETTRQHFQIVLPEDGREVEVRYLDVDLRHDDDRENTGVAGIASITPLGFSLYADVDAGDALAIRFSRVAKH